MKKTQSTEWRIEWIDADGDIQEVDYASTKKEAMSVIKKEMESDDLWQIDLCKERFYYTDLGDGNFELDDREIISTETFIGKRQKESMEEDMAEARAENLFWGAVAKELVSRG